MEKTVEVDGKQVRFKSNGAIPMRYKAQFGKDFFKEILKMAKLTKLENLEEIELEDLEGIDFEVFYNFLWVMAKTADKSIPDPITWLDGFDEFPILDIIPDLQDLILANLQSSKKK